MKKLFSLFLMAFFAIAGAQDSKETANRFFYELTFKPKKDSVKVEKVMTILDITSKKSIYQDYTMPAQDSIMRSYVDKMTKTGMSPVNINNMLKADKFSYKIIKSYPAAKVEYMDRVGTTIFTYNDEPKLQWKIQPDKQKMEGYNVQKAITEFGGRKWIAWFSSDLPFQDGPYKFSGLPGLIIKIEDDNQNYSWVLSGNKSIKNYDETSTDKLIAKLGMMQYNVTPTTKEKFQKLYNNYKADPLAEVRAYVTPESMNMQMPGTNETIGSFVKREEKRLKDFFNSNNNPIEIDQNPDKKKK